MGIYLDLTQLEKEKYDAQIKYFKCFNLLFSDCYCASDYKKFTDEFAVIYNYSAIPGKAYKDFFTAFRDYSTLILGDTFDVANVNVLPEYLKEFFEVVSWFFVGEFPKPKSRTPDLNFKFTLLDDTFKMIDSQIDQMSDKKLLSLITSDIPFRVYFTQITKGNFAQLIADGIDEQRQCYKFFLYSVYHSQPTTYQLN